MTDYSKLKVVDLKAELKKRGLPQSGLKQALVDRLNEADAKREEPSKGDEHPKEAAKPDGEHRDEGSEVVPEKQEEPAEQIAPVVAEALAVTSEQPSTTAELISEHTVQALAQIVDAPMPDGAPKVNDSSPQLMMPSHSEAAPLQSTLESVKKEEVVEDTRKRKRRSQSPPPSSVEIAQKKARQEDGSPRVTLPEDVAPQTEVDKLDHIMEDTAVDVEDTTKSREQVYTKRDNATRRSAERAEAVSTPHDVGGSGSAIKTEQPLLDEIETPAAENTIVSPVKHSPSDTRFKNLFTGSAKRDTSPLHQNPNHDDEDRIVTPVLHPATSALYIRDFMRPLHPGNLKDHLISIATPPSASPKEDVVTHFFLDPIRTHCLVGFASISAASRVRSALHDRVWPDERTRKPLWVDFIPDEKLKEWIDMEQNSTNGRGAPAKRWEVVYEHADKGMQAIFQEIGSGSKTTQPSASTAGNAALDAGKGVQGAPLGPRNDGQRKPPDTESAPRQGANMGFKALDDLFKSTAAKPKLYFLPVAKNVADTRLDKLRALRGGAARIGDEMRRYSFEDSDLFVDKGPEFGAGYRGGYRGRGGGPHSGVYTGRGGGSRREDSWRNRGGR
ncbi:MAG: hypothetical protein M1830_007854 [Pleopsidium flavum]|nr:MAG: hypothetical protein M1830_007854 [Pleopsidium flavum]